MAAKKILTFITAEVAQVVADALAAKELRTNFEDLYNPAFHKGGVIKKDARGFPDSDNIDHSKVPPALWLVGDQGVYLMSNAKFAEGQKRAILAYAEECNPGKLEFDEWYENKRYLFGGDDGGVTLPIEWFQKAVASGKKTFKLQMLAKSIRMNL